MKAVFWVLAAGALASAALAASVGQAEDRGNTPEKGGAEKGAHGAAAPEAGKAVR